MQIDPVISSGEAHNALSRSQEPNRAACAATNSAPFAIAVKDTTPSLKLLKPIAMNNC